MTLKPVFKNTSVTSFLTMFQFIATSTLLIGLITIHEQLQFMKNQDPEIDISKTLVIREPYLTDKTTSGKFVPFKDELEQYVGIKSITYSTTIPGEPINWNRSDVKVHNRDNSKFYPCNIVGVGYDFMRSYGLKLLKGQGFRKTDHSDVAEMLINEEAVKHFDFDTLDDALGKKVFIGNREFKIAGVVNNYHHLSVKNEIKPTLYLIGSTRRPIYSIKVSDKNLNTTIASVKQVWDKMYPGNIFSYFFLRDFYQQQYQSDEHFGIIISLFTGLTIIIACMGLFGLASFTTFRRSKEIGIRKVFGASVGHMLIMLSQQYLKLVLFSLLIAIPIANYFITDWLGNFAYRILVTWWIFVIPGVLLLVIVLLSVWQQIWKAAVMNPTETLRND